MNTQKKSQPSRQGTSAMRGASPPKKGGILAALRRSPLVGANLNLVRPRGTGRKIKLPHAKPKG